MTTTDRAINFDMAAKDKTTGPGKGMWGGNLILFESLPSTNMWAMENLADLRHGDVVMALHQTAGRGRFDRKWVSPPGKCLTVSAILKLSAITRDLATFIPQAAAIAVRATLLRFSIPCQLKWPNDVLCKTGKIAGILVERDTATGALVVGIGINVFITANDLRDASLLQPATSMILEQQQPFDLNVVMAALLAEFQTAVDTLFRDGSSYTVGTWRSADALTGSDIQIQTSEELLRGKYLGMDEKGRLRLLDDSGHEHTFWSGDVTVRRND